MHPVQDRSIFHFTDLDNVAGIVAAGGLHSDSLMSGGGRVFRACANEGIKGNRRTKPVPCPPGGVVADYVPFYYATRSPMMSAINHGRVSGYTSNDNLVYFVSSLNAVHAAGLRWVCTDGNAATGITGFFAQWRELEGNVDWGIMRAQYWGDNNGRHRRMAEFLVHQFVPLGAMLGVLVKSDQVAQVVRQQLQLEVRVGPEHYI